MSILNRVVVATWWGSRWRACWIVENLIIEPYVIIGCWLSITGPISNILIDAQIIAQNRNSRLKPSAILDFQNLIFDQLWVSLDSCLSICVPNLVQKCLVTVGKCWLFSHLRTLLSSVCLCVVLSLVVSSGAVDCVECVKWDVKLRGVTSCVCQLSWVELVEFNAVCVTDTMNDHVHRHITTIPQLTALQTISHTTTISSSQLLDWYTL